METSSVVRYLEHTPMSAFAFMPEPRVAARTFRDLLVWQKAHQFVLGVYSFTAAFPKQETYGLSLQMRRAAVSIPANIAEGFRRRGKADKARYMNIAEGSLEERRAGGNQPVAQRLQRRHSDFWLLTSDFHIPAGISRAPALA